MAYTNKKIVLKQRPMGAPKPSDFEIIETPVPNLKKGEILLKTLFFSLEPYIRGRMNTGPSYIAAFNLGESVSGSAICKIVESQNPKFKVGDLFLTFTGWQSYVILKPKIVKTMSREANSLFKIPEDVKPSLFLGILGTPGITAYHGLMDIGEPKKGETVVVAAATGPVGSVVGQLAKQKGCYVVGIAGGPHKCKYAVEELGFDVCVDRSNKTFKADLAKACTKGIDIYFENVGGPVFSAVLPLLNINARVPVCGVIHWYDDLLTLREPGFSIRQTFHKLRILSHFIGIDQTPIILGSIISKRLKFQGILSSDHFETYDKFLKDVIPLVKSGKIKYKEDIVKGIEQTPEKFIGMMKGQNFGKVVVEV